MNVSTTQIPGLRAIYNTATEKITLPSGTPLAIDLANRTSHPQSNFNQARRLSAEKRIGVVNGTLTCLEDLVDLTPSAAWVLASGRAGSGPKNWKVNEPEHALHGQPIENIKAATTGDTPEPEAPEQHDLHPISLHEVLSISANQAHDPFIALQDYFRQANRHKRVAVDTVAGFDAVLGLDGPGVYIVSEVKNDQSEKILYIGKAGKWTRNGDAPVQMNGGRLSRRTVRWTPYNYQEEGDWVNHFEYGPNFRAGGGRPVAAPNNYRHHIPLSNIVTDCFLLAGAEREVSPALLEGQLLQHFLHKHGDLPPANQEL